MPDEQNYTSYLLSYEEAIQKLDSPDKMVLRYVWKAYAQTVAFEEEDRKKERRQRAEERRLANRTSQRQASANIFINPKFHLNCFSYNTQTNGGAVPFNRMLPKGFNRP